MDYGRCDVYEEFPAERLVHFKVDGFEYRTSDGIHVEALDGNSWNPTSSVKIILLARNAFANAEVE